MYMPALHFISQVRKTPYGCFVQLSLECFSATDVMVCNKVKENVMWKTILRNLCEHMRICVLNATRRLLVFLHLSMNNEIRNDFAGFLLE